MYRGQKHLNHLHQLLQCYCNQIIILYLEVEADSSYNSIAGKSSGELLLFFLLLSVGGRSVRDNVLSVNE